MSAWRAGKRSGGPDDEMLVKIAFAPVKFDEKYAESVLAQVRRGPHQTPSSPSNPCPIHWTDLSPPSLRSLPRSPLGRATTATLHGMLSPAAPLSRTLLQRLLQPARRLQQQRARLRV
jgi:hypothetical protein